MILVLDAGNSRLKWGMTGGLTSAAPGTLPQDAQWQATGAVVNEDLPRLADLWADLPIPDRVVGTNVAGSATADPVATALARWSRPVEWLGASGMAAGVRNGYADPARLGADRWAALIGAWHRQQGACIVVNAGTATTIDLLDGTGAFVGGMILPGHMLMKQALAAGTAGLRLQEGQMRRWPTNTADAIETGCRMAQLGAVIQVRSSFGRGLPVLLSGGAAPTLAAQLPSPSIQVPHLILEGTLILASAADGRS